MQPPAAPGVYRHAAELTTDLAVIADDLRRSRVAHAAAGLARDLMRQVDVFGLHMLTLDVRQHARDTPRHWTRFFAGPAFAIAMRS